MRTLVVINERANAKIQSYGLITRTSIRIIVVCSLLFSIAIFSAFIVGILKPFLVLSVHTVFYTVLGLYASSRLFKLHEIFEQKNPLRLINESKLLSKIVACINCSYKYTNPDNIVCFQCGENIYEKLSYNSCSVCGSEYDSYSIECTICGSLGDQ